MRAFWLSVVFLVSAVPAFPQQIVINELYNSSSTNEWIELVVIEDGLDLRGWDLRDFTSGGNPQDPLEFLSIPLWSNLEAGTVIVAAKPDSLLQEDLDPSDFILLVNTDNADLFDGALFLFAGTSDAIEIRDTSDQHVFGISWGTGNAGSLPEPRVHFMESSTSNTAASFAGDSLSQLPVTEHWLWDNPTPTPGTGNGTLNSGWIDSLRAITASVAVGDHANPVAPRLMQNYPNPFNGETMFRFRIAPARPNGVEDNVGRSGGDYGEVSLKIFDLLGREVATIISKDFQPGTYTHHWNAGGLPGGIYFYRLQFGDFVETKKLILLR